MNGRLENKIKIEKKINSILSDMPDYVNGYYYSLLASGREITTCLDYLIKIRAFMKFLKDNNVNDLHEIKEYNIAQFLISIERRGDGSFKETSFSYRKNCHTVLNGFFKYLKRNDLIEHNYLENIGRPVATDEIKRVKLTKEDLNSIIKEVDNKENRGRIKTNKWKFRDKAILTLLMRTGMRETALTEININDIDFSDNDLKIIDKRHKVHHYYLSDSTKDILKKWMFVRKEILGSNSDIDALFISIRKTRITSDAIIDIVKKHSKNALGYSISPHKLRAAFCTILYDETHDIEFVRDAVGHSSVTVTQRYIVKDNTEKEKAARMIEGLIGD